MKMKDESRTDHIVPLSKQCVEILKGQHALTHHLRWVFPGARSDAVPITNVAMSSARAVQFLVVDTSLDEIVGTHREMQDALTQRDRLEANAQGR